MTAELWKRRSVLKSCAISRTKRWKGSFADQQLGGLLITADLSESHGPGPVTVGLLDAAGGWGALPGGFSSELLPRGFATGGFTSRLLGSCHREDKPLSPSKYVEYTALCSAPAFKASNGHELLTS